ncbi:MAG: UDP-2,4-diacetamido-2,4,6-trideoxy-beta-L-altropyranose hydrolase [candidate division WOR-3 bacterium]
MIRADAGSRMGTGHVMRCLALAQAWRKRGGDVIFFGRIVSPGLRKRIRDEGCRLISLPAVHPDPEDWPATARLIRRYTPEWLVLDGYHFDPEYQQKARIAGVRVLVVDDTAHWSEYHAHVLLNQNMGAERLCYECDPDTRLLLGPRYALLRTEFLKWRCWQHEMPPDARRVLVTMGGSDPDNVTLKVIRALRRIPVKGLEVVVMVGAGNMYRRTLEAEVRRLVASKQDLRIRLEQQPENVTELMAWADVAVSAGGSTCWELAFMGVPTITLVIADNQTMAMREAAKNGAVVCLGKASRVSATTIRDATLRLCRDYRGRCRMAALGRELVDGTGAFTVVEYLAARCARERKG